MKNKYVILFLFPLIFLFVTGCGLTEVNPITGNWQPTFDTAEKDAELGAAYAPEIEKELGGRIQNLTIQDYIDSVGQKIALAALDYPYVSDVPVFDYSFVALEDETVNAFALPGGYIFITRGMLEKLDSEAQLASILGHETVHVIARHSAAQITREVGFEFALYVISSQTSAGAADVAGVVRKIIGLGYSRAQEKQADMAGLDYTVRAGYDPHAMVQTMQMLEAESQGGQIEFMSTHPSPGNRVEYLSEAIVERGYTNLNLKVGEEEYKKFVLDELNP